MHEKGSTSFCKEQGSWQVGAGVVPWLCLLLGERVEDQGISMTCFLMYFQGAGDTRELSWELAEKFPERQRQGQFRF